LKSKLRSESDLIGLIRAFPQDFPASIKRHIGDDCAIFETAFASQIVVTTDLLLENVHFRRNWISPLFLGRKSCLVNASDLAAMGARPYACLLSLGLPEALTGRYFEELVTGFLRQCGDLEMPLIGGDVSRNESVIVSVTAWGYLDSGALICRSGAQVNDHVLLIGEVGCSRLGLEYLEESGGTGLAEVSDEERLREWAETPRRYECLKAHLLPEIQIEPAVWIREKGLANSMIDVSDGLGHDLLHILEESDVSCELQIERVPCPKSLENSSRAREYALDGGEDYALLLTASDEQLKDLNRCYPKEFSPFSVIGRVCPAPAALYLITEDGERSLYESKGYNHFK
jgi:thiamine-monophosphate kinase